MVMFRTILIIIALGVIGACQQAPDPAHSEAEIRAAVEHWVDAFNAEDLEGVLQSYSADLVLSYPGEEDMTSPERFRDLYEGTFAREGGDYTFAADIEEIGIVGDLAFARITWTLTWHPVEGDAYVTRTERAMEIWRYEADGVWRLYRWLGFPQPDDLPVQP
jgi:uncharacterized protein (TIGR02246 family)